MLYWGGHVSLPCSVIYGGHPFRLRAGSGKVLEAEDLRSATQVLRAYLRTLMKTLDPAAQAASPEAGFTSIVTL